MTQHSQAGRIAHRLVDIEVRARFQVSPAGRIEREAPPDGSPGPLLWLAGSPDGNAFAFGRQLPQDLTDELTALAASEPPLISSDAEPAHMATYLQLLTAQGELRVQRGLSFHLPPVAAPDGFNFVSSGTPEGDRLLEDLAGGGMPADLVQLGFRDVSDLWAPWSLLLVEGQIASLAFAARLGPSCAELGLATSPAFRGRGLAAAATAGWSAHPNLAGWTLFYSTAQSNVASQRVAAKLGLRFIGPTFAIVSA